MRVAIIGYGKMGHEIERILLSRGHQIGLIIDKDNQSDFNAQNLKGIDVAIEFSSPLSAFDNICNSISMGIPIVCGTTAWIDKMSEVVSLCEQSKGKFFYSSNYSVGVNLFFELNRRLTQLMNGFSQYDVTVEETHHTAKLDAPSGTAITILDDIVEGLDRKSSWHLGTTTNPLEVGVSAIRRSIVPGTHSITWESEVDQIQMTHTAKSRAGFALGAVLAAEFLSSQTQSGVYSMSDLLKFYPASRKLHNIVCYGIKFSWSR